MPAKKKTGKNAAKTEKVIGWEDLTKRLKSYIAKQSDSRTAERHPLVESFVEYSERTKKPKQVIVSTVMKPIFIKALTQTLIDFSWSSITSLCFWNINCGDEGAEYIANALHSMPWITKLEILDCNLGPKACYHLGEALANPKVGLSILRLDCNPIEGMGVKWLNEGLQRNAAEMPGEHSLKLKVLSLAYCNINWDGGQHLTDLMCIPRSELSDLNLEGNILGTKGMHALARGIALSPHLTKLNIAQNKFADDLKMIDALARAFHRNTKLSKINLDGNLIGNDGCKYFIEFLHDCTHIQQFDITPFVGPMHFRAVYEWLKKNKPEKKRKKKKKTKKK